MDFKIDTRIFETFPNLMIGGVIVRGMDNAGTSHELAGLLQDQCERVRNGLNSETFSDHPKFMAWQKAYQTFGAKPKKYKCSVENLYRMILDGIDLCPINKVVDVYNVISLRHMMPIGGDDLDKLEGDLFLTFAKGDEPFIRLNSEEIDHPHTGEVIYCDDKEVTCRRWNWRECDKSKMTENTKNALLVVEGLPPTTREELELAIRELSDVLQKYCGGEITTFLLDQSQKFFRL